MALLRPIWQLAEPPERLWPIHLPGSGQILIEQGACPIWLASSDRM
jgi:hypothetical protein